MNKLQVRHFEEEEILHIVVADGPEAKSLELSPTITVELNDQNAELAPARALYFLS
jgi:hypothetical protein